MNLPDRANRKTPEEKAARLVPLKRQRLVEAIANRAMMLIEKSRMESDEWRAKVAAARTELTELAEVCDAAMLENFPIDSRWPAPTALHPRLNDAMAALRMGASFADASSATGVPLKTLMDAWDRSVSR